MLHLSAADDISGVKWIDWLAQVGLISKVLVGSYPANGSQMPTPEFWKMITEDEVVVWKTSSGIVFDMLRDERVCRKLADYPPRRVW
ncbi:hypothetical protein [Gemmobacter sp. 24YEA27]|uniref:hypothetical protein n=1 Tax=Gemmobacter sp. 24YEA27 TaxID=3040672 RepID=UPI0024B335D2|nr:hypothetical protein [Gemmobacter sp. 24YEA27]